MLFKDFMKLVADHVIIKVSYDVPAMITKSAWETNPDEFATWANLYVYTNSIQPMRSDNIELVLLVQLSKEEPKDV